MGKTLKWARKLVLGFAPLLILALPGCDDGGLGGVVPASGTVTLDGKPAEGITVSLVPQAGVKGRGGYAKSDQSGKFELTAADADQPGVLPGKYQVLFQKYTMPDGSPIPPDAMVQEGDIVNQLPPIYADPGNSPVFADIPESGNQSLTFELSSNPRG